MTPLNSILNTPLHSRVRFQRKKFCLRGVFISRSLLEHEFDNWVECAEVVENFEEMATCSNPFAKDSKPYVRFGVLGNTCLTWLVCVWLMTFVLAAVISAFWYVLMLLPTVMEVQLPVELYCYAADVLFCSYRYCQDFLFPSLSSSQTQRGNNCLSGHIHPPLPIPLTPTKRRLGDKPLPKPPAKESNMSYTSYTESVVVTFVLGAAAITSLAAAVAGSSMVPPNYSLAGLAC
ncbi:hypothetical protein RHSIM_RhsimUnG0029900 [Rhododendron simsii]|uniref:Uncharacterized protein n=1 Tax=Rhododendron simsii TaxID=118357 RepID=A0A834L5L4_RHOSS|nr:hypothetical protein RHSIM_RhsimUnG0029900 [Rhododendron simsii]